MSSSVKNYRITAHAQFEMARRQISAEDVANVLTSPGQICPTQHGRTVYQSIISVGTPPKSYLLRVIVDTGTKPLTVITAYRTGKIKKYWRDSV